MTAESTMPAGSVILVASEELGSGPSELGRILMRSFLKTLKDLPLKPDRMIFINSGVRLVAEGSDLLEDLAVLAGTGIDLFACGTCLDYFHLKEKVKVGRVSNMAEIASTLLAAGRVVRP